MNYQTVKLIFLSLVIMLTALLKIFQSSWQSKYVKVEPNGTLKYNPDEKGNTIPDFSRVGYFQGDKAVPLVKIVKTIYPATGSSQEIIQNAINQVAKLQPDKDGIRGAILLKKGTYNIPGSISITVSGIVLRGEGDSINGTRLVATGKIQRTLIQISGSGVLTGVDNSKTLISDDFVPVGAVSFNVEDASKFKIGDAIVLYRPGEANWIADLKMDQIAERPGTKQWKPSEYDMKFERVITAIKGKKVFIDNPVVMQIDKKYGGGQIFKFSFPGRIAQVGIENIYLESSFASDTDESHGWTAVQFEKAQNCWVKKATSRYFGFGCVSLESSTKNITVDSSQCLDAKSIITGSRRYSFSNNGQQNLIMNCHTTQGRHDYVTGAKTCGPNVFYNCTAQDTHADIGPHQRWSAGTLYDNITTTGEIAIQDRGNYGTGHGWTGVTQVVWNCAANKTVVQSPWVSGSNYCIGLTGLKESGRFNDRPEGEWEGNNQQGLQPKSLYIAQIKARHILK